MIKFLPFEPESPKKQEQLLALMRQNPVPGAVAYHYERPPGYEAYAKIQGTHFQIWEASEGDELLGFTQITYDQITWNGKMATVSYSGDTRVATAARGKGISNYLIQSACKQTVPVFGAVMGSNKIVLEKKLHDWKKVGVHFEELTELKALLFKPAVIKKRSPGLFCREAHDSDLPAMYFLWKQYSQTRNLTRHYSDLSAFVNSYQITSGISLKKTILVFNGVTLIAMLSLWDQSKVRTLIVDHKNIWMKIASSFLALPHVGGELKIIYSFQHAFLDSDPNVKNAIETMIAKARTISHEDGAHFFSLGMDLNDPMIGAAARSALISSTAKIILDSRGHLNFKFQTRPLHLEVGMG